MDVVATLRRRAGDCAALVALVALAFLFTLPAWRGPVQWTPDGLYYQAKVLQLHGSSEQAALDRVLAGPAGQELQQREVAQGERPRLRDPRWVSYEAQFFQRRWLVPVMALGIEPFAGDRSLEVVTLGGYVACGLLLFLLLRQRFSTLLSAGGAALGLSLSPLTFSASHPLTDTVALALLLAGVLAAVRVMERGLRWLPLWVVALAALAFTRESGIVLVLGALGVAVSMRSARTVALAVSGALVMAVPLLTAHASVLDQVAFALNGYLVPADASLGHVLAGMPGGIARMLQGDVIQPMLDGQPPIAGLVFVAGTVALFALRWQDPLVRLLRWMAPAAVLFGLLNPAPTELRVFLPLIPSAAFGVALVAERVVARRAAVGVAAAPPQVASS